MLRKNGFLVAAIVVILLFGSCTVSALSWRGSWQNTALEFLSANAGNLLVGLPYASLITSTSFDSIPSVIQGLGTELANYLVSYNLTGGAIGSTLGTLLSGKLLNQNGSVLGTYTGGIIGTGLGILTMLGTYKKSYILATVSTLLPSILSVIGYNLFPKNSGGQSGMLPQYFPTIGLTALPEKHNNMVSAKIGANVKFRF